MKYTRTLNGIIEYKAEIANNCGKYGTYIFPLADLANTNNSIDIKLFQSKLNLSNCQINRMVRKFKKSNVLRKRGHIFYLNPLIGFSGKDINLDLGLLFEDELNKVGITLR